MSLARERDFSIPKCDSCAFSSISGLMDNGITILSPLKMMSLQTDNSSLKFQKSCVFVFNSDLVSGQPFIMTLFNSFNDS